MYTFVICNLNSGHQNRIISITMEFEMKNLSLLSPHAESEFAFEQDPMWFMCL